MAKSRKVVRPIERQSMGGFDEQLWPINCVLLILAGFVAGVIIAKSNFDGGAFWQNGWFRLSLLAGTLAVLFAGTWWLHRRQQVRRMQLAVLLSLLLNLGIEAWLFRVHMNLPDHAQDALTSEWIDESEPVTLPDYGRELIDEVIPEEMERPVETETAAVQPQEVERQETTQPPTPTQRPNAAEPTEQASQPAPTTLDRAKSAVSAPRRSDQPSGSQISRQTMQAPKTPTEAMPVPQTTTAAATQETPLNPTATPVTRSESNNPQLAARPQPQATTAPRTSPSQPQLERSETARDSAAPSPAASVARQAPQLPQQPANPTAAVSSPTAANDAAAPIAPGASQVARQQASAPLGSQAMATPQAAAAAGASPSPVSRAAGAESAPTPAVAGAGNLSRAAAAQSSTDATAQSIADPAANPAASSPGALAASGSTSVARSAAAAPGVDNAAQSAAGGLSGLPQSVSQTAISRASGSGAAPEVGGAPQAGQVGRTAASRTASTALSGAAEVPAAAVAEAGGTPAPSANSQATTVGRSGGAVPLPAGRGPSQPAAGDALNTARGLAQAAPRRVETSANSRLSSSTPGAGPLARSQGVASAAAPATAVPIEAPTAAAGSLAQQPATAATPAVTGITRGGGQAPTAAPSNVASSLPGGGGGIAGAPAATIAARAGGGSVGPQVSTSGSGALARSSNAPADLGGASAIGAASVAPAIGGGEPSSQGPPGLAGNNVATQSRQSVGLSGGMLNRGAPVSNAPSIAGPATGSIASRQATGSGEIGPQVIGPVAMTGGRQSPSQSLPAGLASAEDAGPIAAADVAAAPAIVQGLAGDVARQASGALPVQVAALDGPGALAETTLPQPGLPNRRARPDAEAIHKIAQRFLLDRTSVAPSLDGRGLEKPADAFLQRAPAERPGRARARGGSLDSEQAVEMGLEYLAKQQLPDGRWSLQNVATGGTAQDAAAGAGQMQADTAGTGLALLCFLGAGYTHSDGKYRDTVAAGVSHLVRSQKPDGDLFAGGSKYVWYYSHGIAAIALCEAYGMTKDPELREPAQKALNFTLASQHPSLGGWRYAPQSSTDTSVSGWQMMALKSGELAGLSVPSEAYTKIRRWLDDAQALGGAQYTYRPESQIAHQRSPSLAMSAEGLLMRLYTGWDRSHPQFLAGVEHLKQNLPSFGTRTQPLRDSYYWYYATQVMFQAQGDAWNAWNERLRNLLVNSQVQSGALVGSWEPRGPIPDRWGIEAGRLYVTAMHLLMLEVYYRHLPLYKIE